jgi:hypothetical protein
VLWQAARAYGLKMLLVKTEGDIAHGVFATQWVLLSKDPSVLANLAIVKYPNTLEGYTPKASLWTDDYSNLVQTLK